MSSDDNVLNEQLTVSREEDTTRNLFLTFEVENKGYAIEVASVSEIIMECDITIVPRTPKFVKGIINLRGDIIPVICVRERFMMPKHELDDQTCIIVIFYEEYKLGLIVDKVIGVSTILEEDISSPPNSRLMYENQFIKSIGKVDDEVKLLVDIEKLLDIQ